MEPHFRLTDGHPDLPGGHTPVPHRARDRHGGSEDLERRLTVVNCRSPGFLWVLPENLAARHWQRPTKRPASKRERIRESDAKNENSVRNVYVLESREVAREIPHSPQKAEKPKPTAGSLRTRTRAGRSAARPLIRFRSALSYVE